MNIFHAELFARGNLPGHNVEKDVSYAPNVDFLATFMPLGLQSFLQLVDSEFRGHEVFGTNAFGHFVVVHLFRQPKIAKLEVTITFRSLLSR